MRSILRFVNLNLKIMKKLASMFIAAMLIACCMVSCKQNTPSAAAANCIELIKAGDYAAFVNTYDLPDEEKAQLTVILEQKGQATVEKIGGIDKYEILEEVVSEDGTEATVKAQVTYGNGESDESTFKFVKVGGEWKQVMNK